MKNRFDKELKQRLENTSLEEAGMALDKEKLWGRIEKKKSSGRSIALPWLSHIAAVAAGLMIGLFLFLKEEQPQDQTVATQQNAVPVNGAKTDTVYINRKPAGNYGLTKNNVQPKPAPTGQTLPGLLRPAVQEQEEQPALPVVAEQEQPQIASIVFPAVKPRVLHLSDMDNENAHPKAARKQDLAFIKKYLNPTQSGQNKETFSMIVEKEIFNVKN